MAKALTDIRSLARVHTETCLNVLAGIVKEPKSPQAARVAAANSLLDRGWGKAAQILAGDASADPIQIASVTDEQRAKAVQLLLTQMNGHGDKHIDD